MFNKKHLYFVIGIIFILAFFNSILASSYPDGLERVAEDLGFIEHTRDSFSIFADYALPFGSELVSTGLAGLLGVLVTYLVLVVIGKIIIKKRVACR
ncbi:hypothetical protein BBF96_03955 [Anoxybacter fermentans]|uniref:PDGLE domain-containing protein n=1 Tax=Anoxybacter fermentans TaxID=1323375 RepID=A0A3Q9HPD5_9FIRM|nr:PDGLE domain-containing protein [Anoxybacter fermentans]AZR72614.1 hypothetical protein BBF96_03955 [Anoxybacter fermentans]